MTIAVAAEVLTDEEMGRLRRAFVLGLARQPLPVPGSLAPRLSATNTGTGPGPALAALALAAQKQRFQRPVSSRVLPLPLAARRLHEDPRPLLPEAPRQALLRALAGVLSLKKDWAEHVLAAGARQVKAAGFRLHPFDLPRLVPFLKEHVNVLGLAERAYLALKEGEADAPGLAHAEIDEGNWTAFPLSFQQHFLLLWRERDRDGARAALEAAWPKIPAARRSTLLDALRRGLVPNDAPFLESLTSTRNEKIKAQVEVLLRDLQSAPDRLKAAAECFGRKNGKIVFNPQRFSQKDIEKRLQGIVPFIDIRFTDVLSTAGIAEEEFPDFMALSETNESLAECVLCAAMERTMRENSGGFLEQPFIAALTAHAFRTGLKIGKKKELKKLLMNILLAASARLHTPFAPLKEDVAQDLLASPDFTGLFQSPGEEGADRSALALAAVLLLPAPALPRFLEIITPLPLQEARPARDFAAFHLALEEARCGPPGAAAAASASLSPPF